MKIQDETQLNDFLAADEALKVAEQLLFEVNKLIEIANVNTGLAENALSAFEDIDACVTMDRNEIRDIIAAYSEGE